MDTRRKAHLIEKGAELIHESVNLLILFKRCGMKSIVREPNREAAWGSLVPVIDMLEKEHSYTVRAEMPGVKKDDLDVSVHDGLLTINAESHHQHEDKEEGRVIHQERRYGKYVRTIRLGKDVDGSNVKAKYSDGILELELPKLEEVKPKKIEISVN